MKTRWLGLVLLWLIMVFLAGCTSPGEEVLEQTPTLVPTPDFTLFFTSFRYDSNQTDSPVTIVWDGTGDFSEGFMIVWSTQNPLVEAGDEGWVQVPDGSARQAMVMLDASQSYYFRICRVRGQVCEGYSDAVEVVFSQPAE